MLSLLIPVYNYDVAEFVHSLHKQAAESGIAYEIIIIDDDSKVEYKKLNRELTALSNIFYFEEKTNIGRSKIRNKLAQQSKYPYLLFMDCDSKVVSDRFINNYLKYCNEEVVVCGGRLYEEKKPPDHTLLLRWKQGRSKEQFPAESRNKYPTKSFMTNNFMISRTLFDRIKFDEGINGYGHEDTLFGYDLKIKNIAVLHIDNPLIHAGLEQNFEFIEKTKEGIKNLYYILGINNHAKVLIKDIRLLQYYKFSERFKIKGIIRFLYRIFNGVLTRNLLGRNPNLILFDLYKLGYLCTLNKK